VLHLRPRKVFDREGDVTRQKVGVFSG